MPSSLSIDEVLLANSARIANELLKTSTEWQVLTSVHSPQFSIVQLNRSVSDQDTESIQSVRVVLSRNISSHEGNDVKCVAGFISKDTQNWSQHFRDSIWNPQQPVLDLCVAPSLDCGKFGNVCIVCVCV